MAFAKGSVVLKPVAILDDDLTKMASIKGEIAGKLGRLIAAEYQADKVVLAFKDAEKLKDNKKLAGKGSLTYSVEVNDKGSKLELCVQSAKKELARVTLLDGLDKMGTAATVVNMDKGDATIDNASAKQARKFNGPGAKADDETSKLSGLNLKRKIVLCGHGGGADVSGDQQYTASEFGGKSADEIIKFLIKKGLSAGYTGTIYLSGCHTAAGYGNPKSFAAKVHSGFAAKGYKLLSVAGTPGEAWTKDSGDKGAIPSAMSEDLAKTVTKSAKLITNLETALSTGEKDLVKVEAQVKQHELQYAHMRDLILEMPPEARETLEQKLLLPLKKSRDELVPAMQEMQKSNKTLAGAIKSEKAYHAKLTALAKDKKSMQEGTLSKGDYQRKEEQLFTVEDWWGIFGPAKATTAKVQKDSDKLGSLFQQFKAKFSKKAKT